MKILYLTSNIRPSDGTGSYSCGLITAAVNAGHTVSVLLPSSADHSKLPQNMDFSFLLPVPVNTPRNFIKLKLASNRILSDLPGRKYDVVHCVFERYIPLAYDLANRINASLVISAVGSYALEPFAKGDSRAKYYRKAFTDTTGIAAISNYTLDCLREFIPSVKARICPPGFSPAINHIAPKLKRPSILAVGAIKKRKGQDVLVRAFAHLANRHPQWDCVIVGKADDKKLFSEIEQFITEKNLNDRVKLAGIVSNEQLKELYSESSIFALAPRRDGWKIEGYGLVFLEAAACGLPLICTDQCGFAADARDNNLGRVALANDIDALADALDELMSCENLRVEIGRRASAFADTQTWENAFCSFNELYNQAVR